MKEKELRECIEAFYFSYREFTRQPDQVLAARGLNRVHHRILYFIGQNPGIGVGDLLKILDVSKQALNGPLRRLIEVKLVSSTPSGKDRRVRQLDLTKPGQKLEQKLTGLQTELLLDAFELHSSKDRENWLEIMHRIAGTKT